MMKSTFFSLLVLALSVLVAPVSGEGIESLRGKQELDQHSKPATPMHYAKDGAPIPREYVQQPPLIPHEIRDYQIDANTNKCLACHSWANYREAGATKISQTHFEDRDRNVLANVSPRRYFCTQCHVPQADAQPLVENTFRPVTAISPE
jgi:cytochrome c-type protein NapB